MNLGKISGRYAHALYALAEEQGQEKQVFDEMQMISHAFLKLQNLAQAVANPIYSTAEKEQLLTTAAGVNISPLMKQFLNFIIQKGRENFILFMAMSYQDLYRRKKKIMLGKITSVNPLSDDIIERLKALIHQQYDSQLQLSTETNAELIGGFVLEMDNSRFDASVRSELRQIEEKLLAG